MRSSWLGRLTVSRQTPLYTMGASLPRTFHLTFGAAILLHGRISKIRARHPERNHAGYNYESGQWVPIGDNVRPASGGQKGGSQHPPGPRIAPVPAFYHDRKGVYFVEDFFYQKFFQ